MTNRMRYYKVLAYPPGLRLGAATTKTFALRSEAERFLTESTFEGEILEVPP
jgi:hypothetical protein